MVRHEPPLFGPTIVGEQTAPDCQQQANGVTLSRPRDFISALIREHDSSGDCRLGGSQTSVPAEGKLTSSTRDLPISLSEDESFTRPQLHGGHHDKSVTGNQVFLNRSGCAESNLSHHGKPHCMVSQDGDTLNRNTRILPAVQVKEIQRNKDSAQHNERNYDQGQDVPSDLAGPRDEERGSEELITILIATQSQAPAEQQRCWEITKNEDQREACQPVDVDTTTGRASELSQEDKLSRDKIILDDNLNYSSHPQASTVEYAYTDVPPPQTLQKSSASYDSSQTVSDLQEGHRTEARTTLTSDQSVQSRPPSVQSIDCLPTFTSQRPSELPTTMGRRAQPTTTLPGDSSRIPGLQASAFPTSTSIFSFPSERHSSQSSLGSSTQEAGPNPTSPNRDRDLSAAPSAFRPSFKHSSSTAVRGLPTSPAHPAPSPSSVGSSPRPSPFRVVPTSSPTPLSADGFTSPETQTRAVHCFSPTSPGERGFSMRAPTAPSPTPPPVFDPSSSSSGKPLSMRTGPSPVASSSMRSPPCSSPIASSSTFTRSLAASCISQSISQSMAKKTSARHQAQSSSAASRSPTSTPTLPSTHLRRRSPSPKLSSGQPGSTAPAYSQLGCTTDGYQNSRCPSSFLRSPCPSPSSVHSASSSVTSAHNQSPHTHPPCPSFLHSKRGASQNSNNNNNCSINGVANRDWIASPQKAVQGHFSTTSSIPQQSHDPHWSGSHNRVARPFSASEPSSRVQSPTPSPSPASFTRLCSPPPQHNYSSPMANKPPHPRSARVGTATSRNPLGLTFELPRASSTGSTFAQSSSCLSPRILSPPPIGVSVLTNNVAAPQPRNPRFCSSSRSFSSSFDPPPTENISVPASPLCFTPLHSSRAASPSSPWSPTSQTLSHTLRRSLSNLADRSPSPARRNTTTLRRSWTESSQRSLGFTGSGRGSFDQHESGPISPGSGWSSYGNSPSCLSPRAGLQSPVSHSRLATGKGTPGGQHFTSVPWPDVRELSSKYNGSDASSPSAVMASSPSHLISPSRTVFSSPVPSEGQADWGDPELEEGNCRSQLICAYVARPPNEQNVSSSCVLLSSPPPTSNNQHQSYQTQLKSPLQVSFVTTTPPIPSGPSPSSPDSSTINACSSSTKQGNQKTSYATTVNLQIAGSGRITSFSTAQVSLTQTLQGGLGGPGPAQVARRVSINGLSHLSSTLPQ